mgnify:CR=1 FL=1
MFIKALAQYTRYCKDFTKTVGEKIFAHIKKNVGKIVAVVKKKLWCVWKITTYFAFSCVVCESLNANLSYPAQRGYKILCRGTLE